MTESELATLVKRCPQLFHMAERGSWPAIMRHGLLSTSALLDLYGVDGLPRVALETTRRSEGTRLERSDLEGATIRDQKPMSDASLRRCLQDGLEPADWYRLLNSKVFFWLSGKRLNKLLGARTYQSAEHDVLEIATAPLVEAYHEAITLSPINSGATFMYPAPRGLSTFQSIKNYDYAGRRGEKVVELAVTGGVPDIARFVTRVTRRQGSEILSVLA